jgi:hypothetical protein
MTNAIAKPYGDRAEQLFQEASDSKPPGQDHDMEGR